MAIAACPAAGGTVTTGVPLIADETMELRTPRPRSRAMPADLGRLVEDLAAETAALRAILDPLASTDWQLPTPAPGWTIADQVSHLAYFDQAATMAATDP